jgi:hypothetical protein
MKSYILKSKVAAMIIVAGIFLCARATTAAADQNLGFALGFSLLSFADDGDVEVGIGNATKVTTPFCFIFGGVGAGGDIVLGNNGSYCGDAISFNGSITLNNYTKVIKKCVTGGGPVNLKVGASCNGTDTTGTNPLLGALGLAYLSGGVFACDVQSGTPTLSLPAINLPASKQMTITDTVAGGLNFIDVPSMALGNSSTLTISGGVSDTVVLRVDGDTSIGHSARILLAGGLTPYSVVIATQSGISFWGNSTTVNGTILSGLPFDQDDRECPIGSGATINGAVLCEDDLSMGPNARVNYQPAFAVNVPSTCF